MEKGTPDSTTAGTFLVLGGILLIALGFGVFIPYLMIFLGLFMISPFFALGLVIIILALALFSLIFPPIWIVLAGIFFFL